MPIFPGGVTRALAARDDFRRGPVAVSARSGPTGMTWGQLEAFLSGEVGRYSGLISNARAYAESPWVAPSVHVFAATCAARIFRMFREVDGEKERILDHWLIDLMARPNPMARISEYMLKYQTFALYDIDGEVLWHLGRTGQKPTKEGKPKKFTAPDFITIFRKQEAQPVLDRRTNEFAGWNLTLDGTAYFADRDDVIHFPRFDPINATAAFNPFTMKVREPARGRSALDSKRRALSADAAMQNFNTEFFSRGIAPNFAFIGPGDLTEPQKDQFRERLMARMAGRQEPVIMGGQWTIENLGVTQKDAQFTEGRHDARDEILAGRIPPIYVGDRDATYANANAQILVWLESILIPALWHFAATLDVNLLADEPDIWTDLATDDIYALQVAKKELVTSALDLASRGHAPMDVAARTVGLEMETFEGSDVGFGTAMDVPVADLIAAGIPDDQQAADTTDAAATSQASQDQVLADAAAAATGVGLNGAQLKAVLELVIAVTLGQLPRDSGIGQLVQFYGRTPEQAEQIMGSAGKSDVPTTPNPNPADIAAQEAAAQQQQAPTDQARTIRVLAPPTIRIVDSTRMAGPFEYGSTQVNLDSEVAAALLELAASIPDEALAEKGRETDAHITVKYGVAPEVSIDQVIEALAASPDVAQMVERGGGVMKFGRTDIFPASVTGKDYDVVFVAIDSPDLVVLNAVIRNGVESIDTQSTYAPHATLGYVKPGRGAEFVGLDALDGMVANFTEIQFSDTDGNLTAISLSGTIAQRSSSRIQVVRDIPQLETRADDKGLQALMQIIRADDKDIQKLARRFHVRMLSEGAKQTAKLINPQEPRTVVALSNPNVVDFLARRAAIVAQVNTTTAEQVIAAVDDGLGADGIRDAYNERGKNAQFIGRQETRSAINGGRFLQMQEAGVEGIEWLAARGEECPTHPPNTGVDGEVVALGEKFSNGCRFPQDPDGPKDQVRGCFCSCLPANLTGNRSSILPSEKQRAAYYRASVVTTARTTEGQFAGALRKYFNGEEAGQRGRVLAKFAEIAKRPTSERQRVLRMPRLQPTAHPALTKVVSRFLASQVDAAKAATLGYFGKLKDADRATTPKATVDIDWSDLPDKVEPLIEGTYKHVGDKAYKQTGASGAFNRLNETAAQYARRRAAEMVGKKWVDGKLVDNPNAEMAISEATRESLRELAESAFRDGLTPDQLSDQIEEMSDFTEARADSIADTELANVQSAAAMDGWKESGVVSKKRWLLAQNPCAICGENAAAGEIPLTRAFPSGHQQPTAHPGCHCDMAAVLDEAA